MGVREIDRFLEQWQMDARDLHRPFQMHHSFSVAIYAIHGSMAGVVVVCAGPSRAMPSLWPRPRTCAPYPGKGRCTPRSDAGCSPPANGGSAAMVADPAPRVD